MAVSILSRWPPVCADKDDARVDADADVDIDTTSCFAFNPLNQDGWEKTYTSVFIDNEEGDRTGIATERSMGEGFTTTGTEAYKAWETLTVGGETVYEGTVYHLCDNLGTKGLSVGEWNVEISYEVDLELDDTAVPVSAGNVLMRLSTPRLYLNNDMFGTGETWTFNYTLQYIDTSGGSGGTGGSGLSVNIPVSGSFTDKGTQVISVMGESMTAWHISGTYTMALNGSGIPFTRDFPGKADFFWVEGIGLVREEHKDTETDAVILSKELTSMSGL